DGREDTVASPGPGRREPTSARDGDAPAGARHAESSSGRRATSAANDSSTATTCLHVPVSPAGQLQSAHRSAAFGATAAIIEGAVPGGRGHVAVWHQTPHGSLR